MAEIDFEDTIVAVATPFGEGGISVIRVSGSKSFQAVQKVFSLQDLSALESHTIHMGYILDADQKKKDQVLVSLFKRPHSYTGEDVIEISCHGGMVVTKKILDLLIGSGARHANPGEFTKRAFLNGKLDLTQAEAVLDLIKAKSEKSAETAMNQLSGSLSIKFQALKSQFMQIYAHMEAYVDFPEDHLEVYENKELLQRLNALESEIEQLIGSFQRGNLLKEGLSVAIVGKPNVGKSSLFNALLERDRALVSEHPGTTRDRIEEAIEIQGLYIRLMDTAGLAAKLENPLDQMGMQRTREALKEAQAFFYVVDGSAVLDESDKRVFEEIEADKPRVVLVNKSDLGARIDLQALEQMTGESQAIKISSTTREGLDQLEQKIVDTVFKDKLEASSEQITRLRHKNALERSLGALKRTKQALIEKKSMEFITLDLKESLDAIQELVGEVYSEDLLDVIFSEFCIGK